MSPDDLVAVVRLKLLAGLLPRKEQVVVWAGHGEGYPCAACDRCVTPADVEYEWAVSDGTRLRFHWACFRLWAVEQHRVGAVPDAIRHILVARPQALCGECLATKATVGALETVRGDGVKPPGLDAFDVRPGRCGGCRRHTSVVAYRCVPPLSAEAV